MAEQETKDEHTTSQPKNEAEKDAGVEGLLRRLSRLSRGGAGKEVAAEGSERGAASKQKERRMPQPDLEGPSDPDVLLDVPEVSVDEIDLKVEDLDARLALEAHVADLVEVQAGVAAHLGEVELNIEGVMAEAHLQVDLDNVTEAIKETLKALVENPEIVRHLGETVEGAVDETADAVGEAVGKEGAVTEAVGEGGAVSEATDAAGEAAEKVGEGAGQAAAEVGDSASQAVEEAGGAAGEAAAGATEAGEALDGLLDESGAIAEHAIEEAASLGIEEGLIEREGEQYTFEGEAIGEDREAVATWLNKDDAAREELAGRLRETQSGSQGDGEEQSIISERTDEEGRTVRRVQDPSGAATFEYVLEEGQVKSLNVVDRAIE